MRSACEPAQSRPVCGIEVEIDALHARTS
jgi:hypothetical protein